MSIPTQGPAPDFTLSDEEGQFHSLSDYRGKPVVLYFYPRDNTPGCTKEACGFRDDYSAYEKAGVTILGVSPDTPGSHAKFKAKYELPFTLLSDPDHEVLEMYGVWGLKKSFGREYMGVLRTTYLIDENGEIIKIYKKVKPAEHSAEILTELENIV